MEDLYPVKEKKKPKPRSERTQKSYNLSDNSGTMTDNRDGTYTLKSDKEGVSIDMTGSLKQIKQKLKRKLKNKPKLYNYLEHRINKLKLK